MQPPSVLFLVPTYGGNIMTRSFHSFLNFYSYADNNAIEFEVKTLSTCSLIPLGRNLMVTEALKEKDWTHIFWIDADVVWEPKHVHYLLAANKDIVAGFYPAKDLPLKLASGPDKIKAEILNRHGLENADDILAEKIIKEQIKEGPEFIESSFLTTGFMCIKRNVIEDMVQHYKDLNFIYQGEEHCGIFNTMIDHERSNLFLGEDYSFVKRANKLGFKSFLAKKINLGHVGPYEFSQQNEENLIKHYKTENKNVI
tara:strand:- start:2726 stop:3490 length:765 start_codon:yes stop_codon:yes gene_type:complete